jgi:hypothetical protein
MQTPLNKHPYWPLYEKVRRAARRELEVSGAPAGNDAVDQRMRRYFVDMSKLSLLFRADLESRQTLNHG